MPDSGRSVMYPGNHIVTGGRFLTPTLRPAGSIYQAIDQGKRGKCGR